MHIEQRTVGSVMVLSVMGDITMNWAGDTPVVDKVRSALDEGQNRFVLDLGHVRYVDSAGLGEILEAFSAVRNRGGALKLLKVTKRLNDLLILTRLLTLFDCFDQEVDALASFGRQPVTH